MLQSMGSQRVRCDLATEHQQMMGLWECNPIVSQGVTIYSFKKQKTNSLHLCTVFKKVFKFLFIYLFFLFLAVLGLHCFAWAFL